MPNSSFEKPKAFGIPLWLGTRNQFIREVEASFSEGGAHPLYTLNPEILMMAHRNSAYAEILRQGRWNTVDGVGLQKAMERKGARVPERLCGSDLIYDLAALCARKNRALYFVGGAPDRRVLAQKKLQEQFPGLVTGGLSPAMGQGTQLKEMPQLLQEINALRPAVVAVCLGAPRQERWIAEHQAELAAAGVVVVGGLGGTVDFVSGVVPRAPVWIRSLGLEWAYRLFRSPSRLKRQLKSLPVFAAHAWSGKHFSA